MKRYGYDRVNLAQAYTVEELEQLAEIVKDEHKNEPNYGIYLHSKKCMKRLGSIWWAIYSKTKKNDQITRSTVESLKNWQELKNDL